MDLQRFLLYKSPVTVAAVEKFTRMDPIMVGKLSCSSELSVTFITGNGFLDVHNPNVLVVIRLRYFGVTNPALDIVVTFMEKAMVDNSTPGLVFLTTQFTS